MNVLIVEDEAIPALELQQTLKVAGHRVIGPAATADQALDLAAQQIPDIALVNLSLRQKDDGLRVVHSLAKWWRVDSLFISGSPDLAYANRHLALGYLSQPYSGQAVLAALDAVTAIKAGERPDPLPDGMELFL